MNIPAPDPGFVRLGPALPAGPVVLAVPHAGRDYPDALLAAAAVPPDRLRQLEDRHADALVARAVAAGATAFVATRPRAMIDLNRDPREIDAMMLDGPPPPGTFASARTRAGLGLVPRRVGTTNELWRHKLSPLELARRIAGQHRPYHAAIAAALGAAHAQHGIAILLDCHSMPPLRPDASGARPVIVLGDRFERGAEPAFADRLESLARAAGLSVARNSPYAGGYALDHHGRPGVGVHALQLEVDRSLYLDSELDAPGPGLAAVQILVARMVATLGDAARDGELLAAE